MTQDTWLQIYLNALERGHHKQDDANEVTIPDETDLFWIEDSKQTGLLDRPEMWIVDATRHPEAYPDGGRYTGAGNFNLCTGKCYLVTHPIYVQPGRPVRGSCAYMHELRGVQGGGRLGICDGDGPYVGHHERSEDDEPVFSAGALWGEWQNWQIPEKAWRTIQTPTLVPATDHVRLVLRFNLDYARYGGFYYDRLIVEQLIGTAPGPGPGAAVDYDLIRAIVREELDRTRLYGQSLP